MLKDGKMVFKDKMAKQLLYIHNGLHDLMLSNRVPMLTPTKDKLSDEAKEFLNKKFVRIVSKKLENGGTVGLFAHAADIDVHMYMEKGGDRKNGVA